MLPVGVSIALGQEKVKHFPRSAQRARSLKHGFSAEGAGGCQLGSPFVRIGKMV